MYYVKVAQRQRKSECETERQSKWTKAGRKKCWEKGDGGVQQQQMVKEINVGGRTRGTDMGGGK